VQDFLSSQARAPYSPLENTLPDGSANSVYAMHRRMDIYGEDAELFRPERWEGDELKNIGWVYLPFNGGPRLSLGSK
jgi:hypothetical protein